MKKRPIVFSDVDGTIYAKDTYVSNFNLKIIKNPENNISFNIATGNPICPRMAKLAKLLNADYIIGSSGVQIYNYKNKQFVHEIYLDPKAVKQVFDAIRRTGVSAAAWSSHAFYIFNEKDMEFLNKIYFRYETFDQFELYHGQDNIKPIAKIEVYFENPNGLEELEKELANIPVKQIKTHMNLEIISYGASKGEAIKWMLDNIYKDYPEDDVMVIGDSENDYSMFKRFKYSYVMDNAKSEVKEKANYVTKAVTEHGLGLAILDYMDKLNNGN